MKIIIKLLVVAIFSIAAAAEATTVYVSRISTSVQVASANAEAAWKSTYPSGTYWGILRCANTGGATSSGPYWECVAYGEDNISNNVSVVTTTGSSDMPADSCAKAINAWTEQYGAIGTLTGTSIREVYGNGGNQRPTSFICTATGTIPR